MIAISHARLGQCEKSNWMPSVVIFELPFSTPGSAGVRKAAIVLLGSVTKLGQYLCFGFFSAKRFHWFFPNIAYLNVYNGNFNIKNK
jgi:hypothetical protein